MKVSRDGWTVFILFLGISDTNYLKCVKANERGMWWGGFKR